MKTYITVETISGKHIYHFNYIVNDIFVGDEMIINDEICKIIEIENRQAANAERRGEIPVNAGKGGRNPAMNFKADKAERGTI